MSMYTMYFCLENERDNLAARVQELSIELDSRPDRQQVSSLQNRVVELEERNGQLIDSVNQLTQDQSATTASHMQQLAKVALSLSRHFRLLSRSK